MNPEVNPEAGARAVHLLRSRRRTFLFTSNFWLINSLFSQHYMDEILCGNDPHAFTKPDPRNIFYICDKLGVNLKNTIMVGDSVGKCKNVYFFDSVHLDEVRMKSAFRLSELESKHLL